MISRFSCALFIALRFGGLGIFHLELYFHFALEITSHSHFPGILVLFLGALFFLQEKSVFYLSLSIFSPGN